MLRRKDDVRVFRAFQNVLVHLLVATIAAALAAGGINHNLASSLARRVVKLYASSLQAKVAMDGMERRIHGEINFGLRRVQRKSFPLRLRKHRGQQSTQDQQGDASKR